MVSPRNESPSAQTMMIVAGLTNEPPWLDSSRWWLRISAKSAPDQGCFGAGVSSIRITGTGGGVPGAGCAAGGSTATGALGCGVAALPFADFAALVDFGV